jgi:hypothetical protein
MKSGNLLNQETVKDVIVLEIGQETSLVQRMANEHMLFCNELAWGMDGLVRQCINHEPAWPIELEHAIDLTEEAVMPLAPKFADAHELVLQGPGGSLIATTLQACGISQPVLTLDEVEALFNRLVAVSQGRPANQETLPTNVRFVGALLILREFMHHLRIAVVTLPIQGLTNFSLKASEKYQ